jgi:hypothetical protein
MRTSATSKATASRPGTTGRTRSAFVSSSRFRTSDGPSSTLRSPHVVRRSYRSPSRYPCFFGAVGSSTRSNTTGCHSVPRGDLPLCRPWAPRRPSPRADPARDQLGGRRNGQNEVVGADAGGARGAVSSGAALKGTELPTAMLGGGRSPWSARRASRAFSMAAT